jgi:hypothetical protein
MPPTCIDLTGMTFSHLTVLHRVPGGRRAMWACQCTCGTTKTIPGEKLRGGLAKSCGCRRWGRTPAPGGRPLVRLRRMGEARAERGRASYGIGKVGGLMSSVSRKFAGSSCNGCSGAMADHPAASHRPGAPTRPRHGRRRCAARIRVRSVAGPAARNAQPQLPQ